ncbi:hypothetical protein TWF481_012181 [Arthrobotrys musiformis]|uniref:Uncharacterized protein n=1 Tax=Arthrobotrys musiformis TaxID=47236 RepID=A0AAV9VWE6_9PEZI
MADRNEATKNSLHSRSAAGSTNGRSLNVPHGVPSRPLTGPPSGLLQPSHYSLPPRPPSGPIPTTRPFTPLSPSFSDIAVSTPSTSRAPSSIQHPSGSGVTTAQLHRSYPAAPPNSRRRVQEEVDITSHEQFPTLAAGTQVKQTKRKGFKSKVEKKEPVEDKVGEAAISGGVSVDIGVAPVAVSLPEIKVVEVDDKTEAQVEVPAIDIEAPTTDIEAPTTDIEAPATDIEAPAIEIKIPTIEIEVPTIEIEAPAVEGGVILTSTFHIDEKATSIPLPQTPLHTSPPHTPLPHTPLLQTPPSLTPLVQTPLVQSPLVQTPLQTSPFEAPPFQIPPFQIPPFQVPPFPIPPFQVPPVHAPPIAFIPPPIISSPFLSPLPQFHPGNITPEGQYHLGNITHQYHPGNITPHNQYHPGNVTPEGQYHLGNTMPQYHPGNIPLEEQYQLRNFTSHDQYQPGNITPHGQYQPGNMHLQNQYQPGNISHQDRYRPGNITPQDQYQPGPSPSTSISPGFQTANSSFHADRSAQLTPVPYSRAPSFRSGGFLSPFLTPPSGGPGPSTPISPSSRPPPPPSSGQFQLQPPQPPPSVIEHQSAQPQGQTPVQMPGDPPPHPPLRPPRRALSPTEVDRTMWNIMQNLNPIYSSDTFARSAYQAGLEDPGKLIRASISANRSGLRDPHAHLWSYNGEPAQAVWTKEEYDWDEVDAPDEVYLNEVQEMKLRFAIHKLGLHGLEELIASTRFYVLRVLVAAFEETDVNQIWKKYVTIGRDPCAGYSYSLNRKVQVLMTHLRQAGRHCFLQFQKKYQMGVVNPMSSLAIRSQETEPRDEQSNGKGKGKVVVSTRENDHPKGKTIDKKSPPGNSSRIQPLVSSGNGSNGSSSNKGSPKKRLTNVPFDSGYKSFAMILQLASIWDENKYRWYIDAFEEFKFTELIRLRKDIMEGNGNPHEWNFRKEFDPRVPYEVASRSGGGIGGATGLGRPGPSSGPPGGRFPGRFPDSHF